MHYWCVVQSVTIGAYQSLHPLRDTVLYVITIYLMIIAMTMFIVIS